MPLNPITRTYRIHPAARLPLALILCGLLCLCACSPAHVNPLDPESRIIYPLPSDLPSSCTTRVRSVHIAHSTGAETYSVLAEAWSDGSLIMDSVWVTYVDGPALELRLTTDNVWSARMAASYFGDPYLGGVIGQPFGFMVRLSNDSIYRREPVYLFRVIETTPEIISPIHGQTVGAHPDLEWAPFTATFPFHFLVTVVEPFEPPFYETIVWTSGNMDSTRTGITVGDSLSDGQYYWTLTVADPFDNWARSTEGTFTVTAGGLP